MVYIDRNRGDPATEDLCNFRVKVAPGSYYANKHSFRRIVSANYVSPQT